MDYSVARVAVLCTNTSDTINGTALLLPEKSPIEPVPAVLLTLACSLLLCFSGLGSFLSSVLLSFFCMHEHTL